MAEAGVELATDTGTNFASMTDHAFHTGEKSTPGGGALTESDADFCIPHAVPATKKPPAKDRATRQTPPIIIAVSENDALLFSSNIGGL